MTQARASQPESMPLGALDSLFAPVPRTLYAHAPLTNVICQLRFPSILKIEAVPAEFQDRVRDTFPSYQRQNNVFAVALPPELQQLVGPGGGTNYTFSTLDNTYILTLNTESISLATTSYTKWEDFWQKFKEPIKALQDVYKPAIFSRLGLRYQNHIRRDILGLRDAPWASLLRPALVATLVEPAWSNVAVESRNMLRLQEPDNAQALFLQHGFAQKSKPNETTYLIDMDFYTDEQTDVAHVPAVLEQFRQRAWRAFRWCISDDLHNALGPQDLHVDHN